MIVMPAVDLRDGACVQLVGGAYESERIRIDDPVDAALGWARLGFSELHLVDLDAATERGTNATTVDALLAERRADIQVGGGLRTREAVERILERGATRAVVGTRALDDPAWLARLAAAFPGRIVLAADTLGRQIVTNGWRNQRPRTVTDALGEIAGLPLAGVLVTAVHCEGRMEGPDLALVELVAGRASVPVQASGGITAAHDLRALARCGAAAAVVGMALYTGALDPRATAEEFGAWR